MNKPYGPNKKGGQAKTPSKPPPSLMPGIDGAMNDHEWEGAGKRKKQTNYTEKPPHWGPPVEGICAVLLVIITAAYTHYASQQAGANITAANAADSSAKTAAATLKMDRPYVSLDLTPISDLKFLPDGRGIVRIGSVAIDYGRNPALNSQIAVEFVSRAKGVYKWQTDPTAFCENLQKGSNTSFDSFFGGTYFPQVSYRGSWMPEEPDLPSGPMAKAFFPILVACVAYQSQFSPEWLYTGKMYTIERRRHGAFEGTLLVVRGRSVPQKELVMVPYIPHEISK